jgi:hypothetical protein
MINDNLKQKIVEQISKSDVTLSLLFLKFGDAIVRLQDCLDYTSFKTIGEANRAASEGRLPFASFRLSDSQKSERLVSIEDLATHINSKRQEAVYFSELTKGKKPKKAIIQTHTASRRRSKSSSMLA